MQQIWERETDPIAKRELAKTNWEYFMNIPAQAKKRAEREKAARNNFDRQGIRYTGVATLIDMSGVDSSVSIMDGLRLKARADLIIDIPHDALTTYIDELNKIPLGIK